jgi:hypothetical protein
LDASHWSGFWDDTKFVLPELSDFIESDFTAGALSDVVGDCANALPAMATLNAVDNIRFFNICSSSRSRVYSVTTTRGRGRCSLMAERLNLKMEPLMRVVLRHCV